MVSIIIPCYNRCNLIGDSIQSIINQTFTNWELIIVDDGSTDNTFKMVEPFLKDKRIKIFSRPENRLGGGNSARNYGYEKSNGKYIKWLDSDDLLAKQGLQKQVNLIQEDDYDVVFSRSRFFSEVDEFGNFTWDKYWSPYFPLKKPFENYLFGKIRFSTADGLWNKKFIGQFPFQEDLRNSQEWLMLIQQLSKNPTYLIDNEVLVYSRMHKEQMHKTKKISFHYKHQVLARYYCIKYLANNNHLTLKRSKYLFKSMIVFALAPIKRNIFKYSIFNFELLFKTFVKYIIPSLIR